MNKNTLRLVILGGLFFLPFIPFFVSGSFFFPFITTKAYLFRIIVEIIFALWVLLALVGPEYRPRKSWITYALGIFLLVIGIADLFGVAPVKSFWSNSERMEGYIALIHFGMLYLVMRGTLTKQSWKHWWNISLFAAFIMSLYCFLQLLGVEQIHQSAARVDGLLGNAAYLAVYMLINIFIALFYLARENRTAFRYVYGFVALVFTITLYYTATRGAILGLLGGLLIAALLGLRDRTRPLQRKISIAYVGIFVVLVLGFFAIKSTSFVKNSPVLSRFSSISLAELKGEGRSFVWPIAVKGVLERPILGWGQDNFNYVFNEHYEPQMFSIEPWFDRAHNIFLDWAIAGGVLGLLAYLSLYIVFLYYIWKKSVGLSRTDQVLLTGLIAAYFFHNLFVFDNLTSYVLFIALLAFVDAHVETPVLMAGKVMDVENTKVIAAPVMLVLLGVTMYYVNIRPIEANATLIDALKASGAGDMHTAVTDFKKAYAGARLGRPEIVEQLASNAPTVLSSDTLTLEEKNNFFAFASTTVVAQAAELPTDARYAILAGTFFESTGQYDQALAYLNNAKTLTPGKQLVYEEIGSAYINKQDYPDALAALKYAYELDTADTDAESAYLVGAVYARDATLENSLKADLATKNASLLSSDQIASAYIATGRYGDAVAIFSARVKANPSDPQGYINLASLYLKAGDEKDAIATLETFSLAMPQYKDAVTSYIAQIKAGTLK